MHCRTLLLACTLIAMLPDALAALPEPAGKTSPLYVAIGSFRHFDGDEPHPGWLLCDGRTISRRRFAKLFAAVGTRYGNGDGETTFGLPNYWVRATSSEGPLPIGKSDKIAVTVRLFRMSIYAGQ